jgi:predicted MFS family arabinose efflux permease
LVSTRPSRGMRKVQIKTWYFILEGSNSFATVYYLYYLYFFMQKTHGFGNLANLRLAALSGLICMFAAWWGGKFAQERGYFTALKLGFGLMTLAMCAGPFIHSASGQVVIMAGLVVGMSLTWPTLEALVSEGENPASLARIVGLYNFVWAGTGAVAYFVGGAMLDRFGLKSMFYVPAALQLAQLGSTFWLESQATRVRGPDPNEKISAPPPVPGAKNPVFLRLAWFANPFAYIAINTLIAVIPSLAKRFELSTMLAGFCCSVWCFARVAAFGALWYWQGWHYRFRWLLASYLALVAGFTAVVLAPNLTVLILAQILFGLASGLVYYSSLYYSMDLSETKSEHGGIHEAVIGLGNFVGPAVGATTLYLLPHRPHSGTLAVTALLLAGGAGLVCIRYRGKGKLANPNSECQPTPKLQISKDLETQG